MYDKFGDDPPIKSGVNSTFYVFLIGPLVASQETERANIWSVRSTDLGVQMYKVGH
jgi:hypothetical protein